NNETQSPLFVATSNLPRTPGHPFYQKLNEILAEAEFDSFVEDLCQKFYATTMGRPSLEPGKYFRMLLLGYFEGIDSERGIAWRAADSLSVRSFLGYSLDEPAADHSTLSRTRRLIDLETHGAVFTWVLKRLAEHDLIDGKTLGIDATTLEANAALRSIVRRDTKESYEEFLTRLAQKSGIETPTREDLAKLDRDRPHKGSNQEWEHPHDPDARIAKMKDGTTHLAYKAEHAVDLGEHGSGAVLAVTLPGADQGDTATLLPTLAEATQQLEALSQDAETCDRIRPDGPAEVVTDKGYHSNETMTDLAELEIRSYTSEPDRGRRNWTDQEAAQAAVYANRRRIRGARGRRLLSRRGEFIERSFAHNYETGGMRRLHLRSRDNILKRLLVHVSGFNLSLVLRQLLGIGTPRGLQGLFASLFWLHIFITELGEALGSV
ncbi:MAG: putative transposase, partial [Alphaproteobacteria bacterium]